jgi:hypothetical protein
MKNYKFANIISTNGEIFRAEKINLKTNEIFKNFKTKEEIKKKYQEFWGKKIKVTEIQFLNN